MENEAKSHCVKMIRVGSGMTSLWKGSRYVVGCSLILLLTGCGYLLPNIKEAVKLERRAEEDKLVEHHMRRRKAKRVSSVGCIEDRREK